jgi:cytochrome P450
LWHTYHAVSGTLPWALEDAHNTYGPVVRVGPNCLSFTSVKAMHDIHTGRRGTPIFTKTEGYDILAVDGQTRSLVGERDVDKHSREHALFAPSFSINRLAQYEAPIQQSVDLLLSKIRKFGGSQGGIDIGYWFNCEWSALPPLAICQWQ